VQVEHQLWRGTGCVLVHRNDDALRRVPSTSCTRIIVKGRHRITTHGPHGNSVLDLHTRAVRPGLRSGVLIVIFRKGFKGGNLIRCQDRSVGNVASPTDIDDVVRNRFVILLGDEGPIVSVRPRGSCGVDEMENVVKTR